MKDYQGQQILVIGLGLSGRAAVHFLMKRGAHVTAVDRDRELLSGNEDIRALNSAGLATFHDSEPLDIRSFSRVIVSPGIPQTHPLYAAALRAGIEVIGEAELACRHIQKRCFGITGSNGKTTTTLLVAHVLNSCGKKARALGNVGVPLTSVLGEDEQEILVIELSSWQLETLSAPVFDAGAILNITPNHLDRHGTVEAYAAAKLRLKDCLKPGAPLFMGKKCAANFRQLLKGYSATTFGYDPKDAISCDGAYVSLKGCAAFPVPAQYQGKVSHDVENMMAAFALCHEAGVTGDEFLSGLSTFCKPPHRIEFVKNIDGVAYYDDSKASSIDAVMKAVDSLEGSIHLIAGGVHKGASYAPWIEAFAGRVSAIYAIGQAAGHMQRELKGCIPVELFPTLQAALECAAERAKSGENVLLSPGCSSYDMFKDFNHRGDVFKSLVQELGKKS